MISQLHDLGVKPGSILIVHTSFKSVGQGTPEDLIAALRAAVGKDGTLVMPSMSDDDEQVFDPGATNCRTMGIVADTFWRQPGVLRSDNPASFAAAGPLAAAITAPHPLAPPHGIDSPVGRVAALGGQLLLIGVDHSANTTAHLAESLARVPYRLRKSVLTRAGRVEYDETDHCCRNFNLLDDWLGARQRRGRIGNAHARLCESSEVVRCAVEKLLADPLIFLHRENCDECALALASATLGA